MVSIALIWEDEAKKVLRERLDQLIASGQISEEKKLTKKMIKIIIEDLARELIDDNLKDMLDWFAESRASEICDPNARTLRTSIKKGQYEWNKHLLNLAWEYISAEYKDYKDFPSW